MGGKPKLDGRRIWATPDAEVYGRGHLACPGCGVALAARLALKVLGRKTILVVPACCFAVIDGPFPLSAAGVPLLHCAFETAAATASGVRQALAARGVNDVTVVAWAGDGGTYDIGFQALSAAAERNEDILYVCYDNEAYMNTGIQRSGATPMGAWTTTTPAYPGKPERKKDLGAILAAHRIPYFATASPSYVDDFLAKFEKAKRTRGFRFIHILSPCPPGWKSGEADSVNLGFLAVRSRVFPLVEVEEGGSVRRVTVNPSPVHVKKYLERQGRFRHMKEEDVERAQEEVDRRWSDLSATHDVPAAPSDSAPPAMPAPRGRMPTRPQFAEMVKAYFVTFSGEQEDAVYSLLSSFWDDPESADASADDLICRAITQAMLSGTS